MEKIGFIVDSTVYLPKEYLEKNDIRVVSLNIIDGDETYKETEIDKEFIFARQAEKSKLTSSQPSPSEFLAAYEDAFKAGYEKVLVLCLSKGLSGTYQSAILAKNMLKKPEDVIVFDGENAAYGNEILALKVVDLIKEKKSVDEILTIMNEIFKRTELMFTVENLFSLQKGGRLSKTQALLGTVLRVKPVIKLVDGKLKLYHKERTNKKLHQFFIDEINKDPFNTEDRKLHVRIIQIDSEENLEHLLELVKQNFKDPDITIQDYLGPVFTLHVGPKGFGLCWYFE
ncbi:MAG: DegV family protein [Candidatus Izemoplasmataceae bacterium]